MTLISGHKVPYLVEPGRVAMSTAGRDSGLYFVIMEVIDSNFVNLVDGRLRKAAKPKKKKVRHLRLKPDRFDDIIEKARSGTLLDAHVRARLYDAGYALCKEEDALGQE